MDAPSFETLDAGFAGSWPLAAVGEGGVGASVRHLIDLSHVFADNGHGWPDALISETRRHLGGCLMTIEAALLLLTQENPVGRLLAALEGPMIWPAVQRQPHLISPELMAHMRLRAAVSLLARQSLHGDSDPSAEMAQGSEWLIRDDDPAVMEAASALMLAEARWSMPHGATGTSSAHLEAGAVRADLPAEHFTELVWTGAAVLGMALHRAGLATENEAMTAVTNAAFALLARHDEGAGAFRQAVRLARLLRDRGRHAELLGQALAERRYLLFAALAGELIDVESEAVLDVLVHGSDMQLAALCKTLGGTASDYRHLLMDLRIVRGGRDDPAMVRLARSYDDLLEEDVAAQITILRRPAPLRAKLALFPVVERA